MSRQRLNAAIYAQLDDLLGDDEHGELDSPPHVRLVLLRDGRALAASLDDDELEPADLRYLEEQCPGGAIVTELQDGTYSVRYYPNEDAIEDAWVDLCADLDGGASPKALRTTTEDDAVEYDDDDLCDEEE